MNLEPRHFPISSWYAALGDVTFPSVFVPLAPATVQALLAGDETAAAARAGLDALRQALSAFTGACVVNADVCAPVDSPLYRPRSGLFAAATAWRLLAGSPRVQAALRDGQTTRLVVRPFRRMDRTREFRMFFFRGRLAAMSQYCLERHFRRLAGRVEEIAARGQEFAARLAPGLPADTLVADVYLTAEKRFLLVDLNPWGPPTDPLLLRSWDRDWTVPAGLKLIPPPIRMGGDVKVSF
ncbi:MAG: hypothetical protein WC708_08815 [Lentisphaeria bacterium]